MRLEVPTGTVIAGFRVESLLGEGAMGTVYLAEETRTRRRVALKLLAPELARDERFRRRFLRETELAASLDHPHVVPTLASGEDAGTLYLAMAYVEGSDLRTLLRREGRLEPERALGLVEQVAAALDTAHAAGLANTGRVITAAAAVMVAVFASFAAGDDRILKLFGIAMATAVLLDAIVIRSILMPAVLELFGRRTWAFPSWADRRLPRLAIEPVVQPAPAMDEAA